MKVISSRKSILGILYLVVSMHMAFHVGTVLGLMPISTVYAAEITEYFDSDPGWTSFNLPADYVNIGFRNSNFAGGNTGEAGGFFSRTDQLSWYGNDTIGNLTGNKILSASGLMNINNVDEHYNNGIFIGHFDSSSDPPRVIGFEIMEYPPNNQGINPSSFRIFYNIGDSEDVLFIITGIKESRNWSYLYDPNDGSYGSITVSISGSGGNTATVFLSESQRNSIGTLNTFGLGVESANSQPEQFEFYIDNVSYTVESIPANINNLVTFDPDPLTYSTTTDTTGCPDGYVGNFSFDARLTNTSSSPLSHLMCECTTLTNGNLFNADGGPGGVGARMTIPIPAASDYSNWELGPGEYVDVHFEICLKKWRSFRFFVDVLGSLSIDNDGDGFTENRGDCDDDNNSVFPGAPELCDGLDNDCNGAVDDGLTCNIPPNATADVVPSNGPIPLGVQMTGTGTDSDGSIVLYEWDFEGDGTFDFSSTTSGNTSHTYTTVGAYQAVFRVTDNNGQTATAAVTTTVVRPGPPGSPTATASANPANGNAPLNVNLSGSSPDSDIVLYEWDFENDGVFDYSSSTTGNTSHTYNNTGTRTASFRVTDSTGLTGIDQILITVEL